MTLLKLLSLLCFAGALEANLNDMSASATTWGYLSQTSYNIGDDIQSLAAKQFLPSDAVDISRDFMAEFQSDRVVKAILNGWFILTANNYWQRVDLTPPKKVWPPAPTIDPLLISIHLDSTSAPEILTEEGIAYLKQHGPVGARDLYTMQQLLDLGIPAYHSGCLTLALENKFAQARNDITYVVDVPPKWVEYLKNNISSPIEFVTHARPLFALMRNDQRLDYAQRLLDKYRAAKLVVTGRLHAMLPCLAFETPVFATFATYITGSRFSGLLNLVTHGSLAELLSGDVTYDFNSPPSNSRDYLPIRNRLIQVVTNWMTGATNRQRDGDVSSLMNR